MNSDPLTVGSYTYKARVAGNSNYIGADSADEPLSVTAEYFCSPGFWRNADDAAWALTGHSRTDLFNTTVVPSFYDTAYLTFQIGNGPGATFITSPTLQQVLDNPGGTNNTASGPFNLNQFNATGAFLTNAAGFSNSGSTVDNCPINNNGSLK